MRISQIRLRNWKNFTSVDLKLADRMFFYGANAAGKSNLQDAFRFLRDIAHDGGGLQNAIFERGGLKKVRSLYARSRPDVELAIVLEQDEETWEYSLAVTESRGRGLVLKSEVVKHDGVELLRRPDPDDEVDPIRMRQTALEQVNANRKFRPVSDFLRSLSYVHLVPQLVRDPLRKGGTENDPYGADFLERIARTSKRSQQLYLRKINEALHTTVPDFAEFTFVRDEATGRPHLQARFQHWRPQGAWQTEEEFSDGTLRLVGLLWSMLDGKGLLLLEEPELSLNEEIVRQLPSIISRLQATTRRQVFLSTHASEVLNDQDIGPEEVVLLQRSPEGTQVRLLLDDPSAMNEYRAKLGLSEIVQPRIRPKDLSRLRFVF